MDRFPLLRTNAVAQYPATRETRIAYQVCTYVDGSEQRFRESARTLRWTIQLSHLSDREARAVGDFFNQQRGRAGTFLFPDPWTGKSFTACFESDELNSEYAAHSDCRTQLLIREVRL